MGEKPKGSKSFGLDLDDELTVDDPVLSDESSAEEGEVADGGDPGREVSEEEYQRLLASANIPPMPSEPSPEDITEGKAQVFEWEGNPQTARLVYPPPPFIYKNVNPKQNKNNYQVWSR